MLADKLKQERTLEKKRKKARDRPKRTNCSLQKAVTSEGNGGAREETEAVGSAGPSLAGRGGCMLSSV